MKLKLNKSGTVDFVLLSGTEKVKSTMLFSEAQGLLKDGSVQRKGNQVVVNGKFIFDLDGAPEEVKEVAEEKPAIEDKPLSEAVKETKPLKKPRKKAKK